MPQSMRPDTRQHLTACSEPSEEKACIYGGVHTRFVAPYGIRGTAGRARLLWKPGNGKEKKDLVAD